MAKRKPVSNRVILTAEEYKAEVRAGWSEAQFLKEVLSLAKRNGWRSFHQRPGLTAKGRWVSAVQGDGKGFPDTILLRKDRLVVLELKVGSNDATIEQEDWLEAFAKVGATIGIYWPEHWDEIERILA